MAVDTSGTVYVADGGNHRVVAQAAGSTSQTVLPFTGLGSSGQPSSPGSVAVDTSGTVYVNNVGGPAGNPGVVALAPDSTSQTALPFTGLDDPNDVAVDSTGTVYVADSGNNRVVSLAAESR